MSALVSMSANDPMRTFGLATGQRFVGKSKMNGVHNCQLDRWSSCFCQVDQTTPFLRCCGDTWAVTTCQQNRLTPSRWGKARHADATGPGASGQYRKIRPD